MKIAAIIIRTMLGLFVLLLVTSFTLPDQFPQGGLKLSTRLSSLDVFITFMVELLCGLSF
jgi:hypothetical protein